MARVDPKRNPKGRAHPIQKTSSKGRSASESKTAGGGLETESLEAGVRREAHEAPYLSRTRQMPGTDHTWDTEAEPGQDRHDTGCRSQQELRRTKLLLRVGVADGLDVVPVGI